MFGIECRRFLSSPPPLPLCSAPPCFFPIFCSPQALARIFAHLSDLRLERKGNGCYAGYPSMLEYLFFLPPSRFRDGRGLDKKTKKESGFLKTGDKTLRDMLSPLGCTIRSIPSEYGFALPGMVELLRQWNLYTKTRLRKHYEDYKLLKDVLHRPRQRSLDELRKIKYEEFLEKPLGCIIPVQTYEKDAWTFLELLRLQDALIDSQLLMGEGKPSDQSCYFLLVGPPRPNTLFILKEGIHFHGIKDPLKFFGKYCDFHCRCS